VSPLAYEILCTARSRPRSLLLLSFPSLRSSTFLFLSVQSVLMLLSPLLFSSLLTPFFLLFLSHLLSSSTIFIPFSPLFPSLLFLSSSPYSSPPPRPSPLLSSLLSSPFLSCPLLPSPLLPSPLHSSPYLPSTPLL